MTSSQPRQKKANKNVLAFRRSHGNVVSRRKVGCAASRWLRGGANFPCNYARLLFIIMYTNGALRDSANTPRHSNSKRISLIHRIQPSPSLLLTMDHSAKWEYEVCLGERERDRELVFNREQRLSAECNEGSSIHPLATLHARGPPLLFVLKSSREDYLANHFGQAKAIVPKVEGRRKVNSLVNFSHEIFEVPFHLHPQLSYIDSFPSNLAPFLHPPFLFSWTITLAAGWCTREME